MRFIFANEYFPFWQPLKIGLRTNKGLEFIAKKVWGWIAAGDAQKIHIEPRSPWENGYCENFNTHFRDELLKGKIFYTHKESQILIEKWQHH